MTVDSSISSNIQEVREVQ